MKTEIKKPQIASERKTGFVRQCKSSPCNGQPKQPIQAIQKDKQMHYVNHRHSATHQPKHPVRPGTHGGIKAARSIGTGAPHQLRSPLSLRLKGHRHQPRHGHANTFHGSKYRVGEHPRRFLTSEKEAGHGGDQGTQAQTDVSVLDDKDYADQDQGALEVWSVVEDLLLRLNRLCPASVAVESDGQVHLVLAGFKDGIWEGADLQLRYAILDTQRYRWSQNGRGGYLVSLLHYRGSDLLLTLTLLTTMRHWPDGDDLCSRVGELLSWFQRQIVILL